MKVLERPSRIRPRPEDPGPAPAPGVGWAVLLPALLIGIQLGTASLGSAGIRFNLAAILAVTAISDLFVVAVAWGALARFTTGPLLSGLGFRLPDRRRDFVILPLVGLVLTVVGLLVADVLYGLLNAGRIPPPQETLVILQAIRDPGLRILAVLVVGLVAPFSEEVIFRGAVFGILRRRISPVLAGVFSAALFSLAHLDLSHALHLFAIGLILAWMVARSGSLYPGMILHALINSGALLLAW